MESVESVESNKILSSNGGLWDVADVGCLSLLPLTEICSRRVAATNDIVIRCCGVRSWITWTCGLTESVGSGGMWGSRGSVEST